MTTKIEDAASIVGEELAQELDEKERSDILRSEAVIVRSEEVERSGDMAEEPMHMPYGGATSFAELKAFMDANKEQERIQDIWYAFQVLARNVWMGMDEDKPAAIAKLADEFKGMVKNKSAVIYESLAEYAMGDGPIPAPVTAIDKLAETVLAMDTRITEMLARVEGMVVQKPVEEPAHPLQAQMAQLRADYDSVALMEGTPEEKLQSIQAAYSELGEAIRKSFTVAEPPAQAQASDMLVALLSKMNDKMDLMMAQRSAAPPTPTSVPSPRSISPASVPQQGAAPVQRSASPTPKLRDLIERSVGL